MKGDNHICLSGFSIPSGTPRFLQVFLRCLRQPVVDRGPDILLVHSHSVCGCRNQNTVAGTHEPFFHCLPFGLRQARMIVSYPDALEFRHQSRAKSHCVRSLSAEDDGRLFANPCQLYNRLNPVEGSVCSVDDVGPVGIGLDYQRTGEEQTGADIPDGLLGCGGGEGQDLMRTQADDGVGKRSVCRAEVLAPLGDYMCLVHHKQADMAFAELLHDRAVLEAFSRGDHDFCTVVQL